MRLVSTGSAEGARSLVQILSLRSEQPAAVGEVFAGSQADYPFCHLYHDPARRAQVLGVFFTATVRDAMAFGAVDAAVADGRLVRVAVWLQRCAFP